MRRISLAIAVVGTVLLATATTHAAVSSPLHSSRITGLAKQVGALAHVRSAVYRPSRREATPMSVSRRSGSAPSAASAQTLALPASAFSPGSLSISQAVADADIDGSNPAVSAWFRSFHSSNYSTFGFQYGFYQRADWSATSPITEFRYLGSYMATSAGASSAWSDGVNTTKQNFPSAQSGGCSNNTSVLQCTYIVSSWTDTSTNTQYDEEFVAAQYDKCLAEMSGDIPTAADTSANSTTVVGTLNAMLSAAVTALGNTCGSGSQPTATPTSPPPPTTDFSVISVRFEKAGAQPDWQLSNAPVTQAKVGTSVLPSLYVDVRSVPANSSVTVEFQIKLNGKTVLDKTYGDTLSDADTYRYHLPNSFKLTKAGTYTLTAAMAMNGKSDGDQASLKAIKKYKAPKKISFSYKSLTSENQSGGATSSFKVGQQVVLDVKYTVKNLKGHTTGFLIRSVLGANGKSINTSVVKTTVVKGANDNSVSAQFSAPGTFQIAVSVVIGPSKQSKTVTVNVSR